MELTCTCRSRVESRRQADGWNPTRGLYGYGVTVLVRVHTGECPLADEVLAVHATALGPQTVTR